LANLRAGLLEQPAILERAQPQTRETAFGQIIGESGHQALAILRAVGAAQLELDDIGADVRAWAMADKSWR